MYINHLIQISVIVIMVKMIILVLFHGVMKIMQSMIFDSFIHSKEELIGLNVDGIQIVVMCLMHGELTLILISRYVTRQRLYYTHKEHTF